MRTFERSRPGIAAQAVGIAQGALEVATAYAASAAVRAAHRRPPDGRRDARRHGRRDRGRPPAAVQGLRRDRGGAPDAVRWAAMCKLVAGDAAMRVTTDAVQVLGRYGYIDEFPVERMMRDAKLTQLYEGTQQIQRLVVARALLGKDS
jgi:alkylation response protein AidB-like acyl-CoA dehydrogenase